ncbi:MAG: bifunctional nuclease family protein [Spirochaetales bacterium]|nr:bifunctional nuclease family protein [Spirochaetales bacterium]
MQKMSVKGVILDQVSDMPFIILRTDDNKRNVSIGVGPAEAIAIIMALEGMRATRPLTHDLFVHFFLVHRFKVERVEIYEMNGSKYFAKLFYRKGLRHYRIEVRPSDGLALAVRLKTPIFVKEEIIEGQTNHRGLFENNHFFRGVTSDFEFKN